MSGRGNNLVSLVSGAALGAVAMYLLDPQAGSERREQLGSLAEDAFASAGSAVHQGIQQLNEKAAALGAMASEHAESLRDSETASDVKDAVASAGARLTHLGRDLLERAKGWTSSAGSWGRGMASDASDATSSAAGSARSAASEARDKLASLLGYEEHRRSHTARNATFAAGAIVTAAAAAGAIYFLDPANGRRRRGEAMDKAQQIVAETGHAFRGLGSYCQNLMNRTRETAHDLQDAIGMSSQQDQSFDAPAQQQQHSPQQPPDLRASSSTASAPQSSSKASVPQM